MGMVDVKTRDLTWRDLDERFPELSALEHSTISVCAVPLQIAGRIIGALRFSFASDTSLLEIPRAVLLSFESLLRGLRKRGVASPSRATNLSYRPARPRVNVCPGRAGAA